MTSPTDSPQERYEQLCVLGRGGAGVVYLVRDRETGNRLALKRFVHAEQESLLRLKREFRALAGISHPNLVKLYELGQDQTSAYFTMEYLDGEELAQHLEIQPVDATLPAPRRAANSNAGQERTRIERVLRAFEQLAMAVCALHASDLLHRDLKPSNVMVANGRVVVLDFGIALHVGADAATVTENQLTSGTPAYMAPEQVLGVHIGEPNDWYAFGAMFYEALSGRLPIDGNLAKLLQRKNTQDPLPIGKLVPSLPEPVAELCMQLLRRAPEERPRGDSVLRLLRAHINNAPESTFSAFTLQSPNTRGLTEADMSVFGRDQELAELWAAFRSVQAGQFAVVHVFGESGSGKSLLLHHFCDELAGSGVVPSDVQPLVLRSRCYEREALPFKALDAAIDALVGHLLREPDVVVSHTLPHNLLALSQLFPALKSLPAARQLLSKEKLPAAMSQARAQAEDGLHDMLQRLGQMRPVVLWIDDLQWGDLDSIGILRRLKETNANLMLVLSYRSEEIGTSPALCALGQGSGEGKIVDTQIAIAPLDPEHQRALCRQRFEFANLKPQEHVIERIVLEARGSPFLASQLTALAVAQPNSGEQALPRLTLEELVRSRRQTLSAAAGRLLNAISIAARPIPLTLAVRAADVAREAQACIHELQTQQLIRTRESAGGRLVEIYHDRLREVVQGLLSPEERLELDQRLLSVLRQAGSTDSDWLHTLALSVGDDSDALRYGIVAADRAIDMLAFERAAELYARCVTLSPDPHANNGDLWHKLALAYSYAGHGLKAANVYLQAAPHVSAEQALQFERAAASQLICSGRFDEGEALVMRVLDRLDMTPPRSEAGLFAALGWERARLAARGLNYTPRPRSEVPFLEYFRGEFSGMLSMETAAYHPLRAALFQARCMRWALDTRSPEFIARALCAAATMRSLEASERARREAEELLQRAETISNQIDSPVLQVNIASAHAICAFLTGRLVETIELCEQAEHVLRTASGDSEYHHRFTLASARIASLLLTGRYREAEVGVQTYLKEAAATENINAELHLSVAQTWVDSNADRVKEAIGRLERQREQLPRIGFGMLHVLHTIAVMIAGCATGQYEWALDVTRDYWRGFQRSVIRRSIVFAASAYAAHARLLLCHAVSIGAGADVRRQLALHRAALKKMPQPAARGELCRIDARIALIEGDKVTAAQKLSEGIEYFDAAGARDQVARDRFALSALKGGQEGAELQRVALASLAEMGVVAPLTQLRGYYPELME